MGRDWEGLEDFARGEISRDGERKGQVVVRMHVSAQSTQVAWKEGELRAGGGPAEQSRVSILMRARWVFFISCAEFRCCSCQLEWKECVLSAGYDGWDACPGGDGSLRKQASKQASR